MKKCRNKVKKSKKLWIIFYFFVKSVIFVCLSNSNWNQYFKGCYFLLFLQIIHTNFKSHFFLFMFYFVHLLFIFLSVPHTNLSPSVVYSLNNTQGDKKYVLKAVWDFYHEYYAIRCADSEYKFNFFPSHSYLNTSLWNKYF